MRRTTAAPRSWIAYPPPRPSHSPLAAHSRGGPLPRLPDLLRGPAPRPLRRRQRRKAVRLRVLRSLDLDQIENLEAAVAQEPDPIAVAEVEVDVLVARPLEAVHAEV